MARSGSFSKMTAIKKTKKLLLTVVVVALLFMALLSMLYASELIGEMSLAVQALTILVAVLGVYAVIIQLIESKKVQQADFVVGLNESFVTNSDYSKMYVKLEEEVQTGEKADLSRIEVSNYLTFFETIYLMLRDEVIDISIINDLFSYRFFLAVHSEGVQEIKLVSSPKNFRNIYYLERMWMDYRREKGLIIHKVENSLKKACERAGKLPDYQDIMKYYGK